MKSHRSSKDYLLHSDILLFSFCLSTTRRILRRIHITVGQTVSIRRDTSPVPPCDFCLRRTVLKAIAMLPSPPLTHVEVTKVLSVLIEKVQQHAQNGSDEDSCCSDSDDVSVFASGTGIAL